MSVGARHGTGGVRASTRACPTETARATRAKRRKGSPRWACAVPSRARACGRRKRQLQLGTATRSPPPRPSTYTTLQVRFHDAHSSPLTSPVLISLSLYPPLHPLSSPSRTLFLLLLLPSLSVCLYQCLSVARARPRDPGVSLRPVSTLLSFLLASASGYPVAILLHVR